MHRDDSNWYSRGGNDRGGYEGRPEYGQYGSSQGGHRAGYGESQGYGAGYGGRSARDEYGYGGSSGREFGGQSEHRGQGSGYGQQQRGSYGFSGGYGSSGGYSGMSSNAGHPDRGQSGQHQTGFPTYQEHAQQGQHHASGRGGRPGRHETPGYGGGAFGNDESGRPRQNFGGSDRGEFSQSAFGGYPSTDFAGHDTGGTGYSIGYGPVSGGELGSSYGTGPFGSGGGQSGYGSGGYGQGSYGGGMGSSYAAEDRSRGQGSHGQGGGGNRFGGAGSGPNQFSRYPQADIRSRRGPKGYQRSDERLREEIIDRLVHQTDIDLDEVEIDVKDATVTLTGSVGGRHEKHRIEDLVDGIWGVKDINNNLKVQRRGGEERRAGFRNDGEPTPQEYAGGAGHGALSNNYGRGSGSSSGADLPSSYRVTGQGGSASDDDKQGDNQGITARGDAASLSGGTKNTGGSSPGGGSGGKSKS